MENNFVKLEISEIINKFHRLVKEKVQIKLWKKGEDSIAFKTKQVRVLKSDSRITMVFFSENSEFENANINQTLYISFELNDMAYFSEGRISLVDEDQFEFVISDPVYRTESRINERLITFPHHKVYAFFDVPNGVKESTNIVPLKKSSSPGYDGYKLQQKERLYNLLESKIGPSTHLIDFRVLDISLSGIAFLVQSAHKKYFEKLTGIEFFILFEEEVFKIEGAKTVYIVDFLNQNPEKDTESLFKVGMTYLPQSLLAQKINTIIKSSEKFDTMRKEFESFKDR
ncbi:MAG: hypothetical protein OHK0056_00030 [Bacteriovoracaceae bacterium]